MILSEGKSIAIPAAPVAKVVDTTGAGDLYAAGFLYGDRHRPRPRGRRPPRQPGRRRDHLPHRRPAGERLQDLARKAGLLG